MTRGKRLDCPNIVIVEAAQPKFATRDDAWAVIGPAIARLIAQTILKEEAERDATCTKKTSGE